MTALGWLILIFGLLAVAGAVAASYAWYWAFRTVLMGRVAVKDAEKAASLADAQRREMLRAKFWYDAVTARELATPEEPW